MSVGANGYEMEVQVRKKLPVQICDVVHIDLTIPRSVEPLVRRANKQEVPVLLLKTLLHVDTDRHKGKNVSRRIIQRSKSADSKLQRNR